MGGLPRPEHSEGGGCTKTARGIAKREKKRQQTLQQLKLQQPPVAPKRS